MVHQLMLGLIHNKKDGIKMIDEKLKKAILEKQGNLLYTTLAEECSEIIQACSKIVRKKYYNQDFDIDNLLEEICDVELNLELIKDQLAREKSLNLSRQDIDKKIENWMKIKNEKVSKIFL